MPLVVGLIASLVEELRPVVASLGLRPALAGEWRGRRGDCDVRVVLGGVGAEAAGTAAEILLASGCQRLLTVGFAGALQPDLPVGGGYVVERVRDAAGGEWMGLASEVAPAVLLVSAEAAVGASAAKRALGEATGAALVDLETAGVARAAAAKGVPWLGLRAVSDALEDSLPAVVQRNVRPDLGRVRTTQLVATALVQPHTWPALIGLARRSAKAGKTLGRLCAQVVEEWS